MMLYGISLLAAVFVVIAVSVLIVKTDVRNMKAD